MVRLNIILSSAALALAGAFWHADRAGTQPAAATVHVQAPPWSAAEIDAARARCKVLLEGRDIIAVAAEPIREDACGAPAPIRLISIGADPQVSLSPPPLVTCELAAAMAAWLEDDVQPAARDLLGGPVIRIEVMSAYSCRNAYARRKGRLSEHGRANALDIAMFVTERGEIAHLRTDWGDTARDVQARLAAAQREKDMAARTESGPIAIAGSTTEPPANQASQPALSVIPPSRLGGPRPPSLAEAPPRQRFLRRIHAAACRHFGTVLGPEANEAHRNHFHLDMAERTVRHICE